MGAHTTFEEFFKLLKQYQEEYGHCDVPRAEKVGTVNLGSIVQSIRTGARKTTAEEKVKLDSIGFVWKVRELTSFEEVFRLLSEYKKEHGHCDVPVTEKIGTVNLGDIVQNIRTGGRKTTAEEKAMLDSIGFKWKVRENPLPFEEVFSLLNEFKTEHGHCDVPKDCTIGTVNLGGIVNRIRYGHRKTTPEQKAMLDSIDFIWKEKDRKK